MTPRLGPGRRWGRERDAFEGRGRIEFENSQIHFGGPGLEVGGGRLQPCGLREARQTPTPARVPFPEPLLSLSPGAVCRVHLGCTYNQDATFHPPYSPLAATVPPHFTDKGTKVAEPPSSSL